MQRNCWSAGVSKKKKYSTDWIAFRLHVCASIVAFLCLHACVLGPVTVRYFYTVRKERMVGRQWAQTNGQSGKRKETLPMGQPPREDILPMGQWRERTGKIHIGPSALPPLYSDKIFKSSHYFTLGYSVEMPRRKPQNVYMLVHTQFWCIDSCIKISSSH